MNVELLQNSSLNVCATAIRTCWDSHDNSDKYEGCANCGYESGEQGDDCLDCDAILNTKSSVVVYAGEKDKALIERVGNKFKHASTLEHLSYTFYISGVSRALLQELARHRMASPSVKSTRYTLKELKEEQSFVCENTNREMKGISIASRDRARNYLVFTGIEDVDNSSVYALENLRKILISGVSNDKAKYCLPESYKTELTWTINARSLQNFLHLRTSKAALWEIRDLANMIFNNLPYEHRYLFEDSMDKGE